MALPILSDRVGHIVAVEGPADLVSTQLRLLPSSHQILILPSLQHYLTDANPDAPFDARELILRYHTAAQTRHAEALEFLRPPTLADERRVVFMHGGTMSAQVSCLSTIMEHESDDDVEEAHATLIRLSTHGVAGLSGARLSYHQVDTIPSKSAEGYEKPRVAASNEGQGRQHVSGGHSNSRDTIEDRIIRAMKAADALDKETEFLQPVTPDVDLTVKLVDIPSRSKKRPSSTVVEGSESLRDSRTPSPPRDQARRPAEPLPRVLLNARSAEEPTSAAPRKPPLRIRIPSPPIPWAGDVAANGDRQSPKAFQPQGPGPQSPRHRRPQALEPNLSSGQASAGGDSPRGNFGVPSSTQDEPSPRDNGNPAHPTVSQPTETEERPFESVLPLLEDLVVYFTSETPNELHNFVFRRLSEGCKSPRPSVHGSVVPQHDAFRGATHLAMGEGHEGDRQSEDAHAATPWIRKDLVHGLPTPNHSPNPLGAASAAPSPVDTKLYSISVDQETAVSIQNFLRSFLASQFPLQDRRFSTAEGAEFSPEAGLWRPFECDGQVGSPDGESRLDLILAVGAESGVTKNRLSEVVGQLEKLGFKTSGLSRSGRLDIRYLIANAMQAFTAQPLTKQTQSNPFADRALLAALIIPHLETYLATHPDVRFLLIEYPSEHLPTVLALQTLIGTDMMKVVGIIDSDTSSPMHSQSLSVPDADRRPSEGFRSLNRRGSRLSGAFVGPCSFSKANFLLASSATSFETAAFVAAIRESLISISDYYIPERPLYKHPPQSPPRKAYQSLGGSTKAASTVSASPRKETSRVSVSTLIITPPSSPTEPSPPAQTQPHHLINPRSIPPRSSSSTASPPRGPNPNTSCTNAASTTGRIRWGEVNYAPSTPTNPTRPLPGSTLAGNNSSNTIPARGSNNDPHRHRHKDSDPLSPRGSAPSPSPPPQQSSQSAQPSSTQAAAAAAAQPKPKPQPKQAAAAAAPNRGGDLSSLDDIDSSDDSGDDSVPDAEERRLMPLYLQRREEIERGRSSKAWRWLGLV